VVEQSASDALYGVGLAEFTAARNLLVKTLKAEGKLDEAAAVAKLRKPSVTAWAINQVARQRGDLIGSVLLAGRKMREAMSQAVGGDRSGLAEARDTERAAIEATVEAAAQQLAASGHPAGDDARRRMTETLRSATVEETVADLVSRGVLDADKESIGFNFVPIPEALRSTNSTRSVQENQQDSQAAKRQQAARMRMTKEIEALRNKSRRAHEAADQASAMAAELSELATVADTKLAEVQHRLDKLDTC